jgi:hypothetical protein
MTIGQLIREERLRKGWTQDELYEAAAQLPGAPESLNIDLFKRLERRVEFRADDPREPLGWACRALGIGPEVVGKAFLVAA